MNDVLNDVTYNLRMYWEHYPRLELHYHFQIITSSKGYEYCYDTYFNNENRLIIKIFITLFVQYISLLG